MKNAFFCFVLILVSPFVFSQKKVEKNTSTFKKIKNNLYGSFESNAQYLLDDDKLNIVEKKDRFRANSYLNLNYNFLKNFTAGIQVESYAPKPLKNYYEGYEKTNIANYYLNYKTKKLDVTLGHFYEQFGSGLILRAFEERSLGLNNALRGARVSWTPYSFVNLTGLYGRNRHGFKTSKSDVFGFNTDISIADAFKITKLSELSLGFSYVGRKQPIGKDENIKITTDFPELVNAFSFRANVDFGKFYTNIEYVNKGVDISYKRRRASKQKIIENRYFNGTAFLFNIGYTKKGFGLSGTFRRLKNMSFFARRDFVNSAENPYGMLSINYIPSLAKQYSYSLANIYLYQAQSNLLIADFDGRAGETGGKIDFFYTFKKGSCLGGKYGTKLNANFSYWSLLDATFYEKCGLYSSKFLGFGKKLNRNFSIEIDKKWSKKVKSKVSYINSIIDKGVVIGSPLGFDYINFDILAGNTTLKLNRKKSLKLELQHLWTNEDKKNWVAGGVEFNLNSHFSFYANDMYNYGNEKEKKRIHYYNLGGSFTKGATRIALNYGRQRGGLVCAGGVCRYISPNTGFTLSLNTSF